MKTLFFYTDTETTGLLKERDQILTFAKILVLGEETLVEEEIKVKIKDNNLPNVSALLVNNVNPFAEEHIKNALSEYDAAHHLADFLWQKKQQGFRIVLIAYNSDYDEKMYRDMFHRTGIVFESLIDIIYDPLKTASMLVDNGSLKTREVQTGYGKSYKSKRLEDVYNALGFSSHGLTTHNSLEDTKILKTVASKLYMLQYGKTIEEAEVRFDEWTDGSTKTILLNEDNLLIQKTIKIIKTHKAEFGLRHFLVLDYEKYKETTDFKKSIYWINTHKVFDQLDATKLEKELTNEFNKNFSIIDSIQSKINTPTDTLYAGFEEYGFGKIEKIAESKLKGHSVEASVEELNRAEEYSYSRFNQGWSVKEKGVNYQNEPMTLISGDLTIINDPVGLFRVKFLEEVIIESTKKTEIMEELKKRSLIEDKSDKAKEISSFMVPIKSFTNPKHYSLLEKEFNEKKTEVFNGSNQSHKEMMKGLLSHYKKINPIAFSQLSLPDFKINLSLFKKK